MNKNLYVCFVKSNTKAGFVIRKLTGWKYSHVSISLDDNLEIYSAFSRLNYKSSFMAGFTYEYKSNYTLLKKNPVEITYYKIPINDFEYNNIVNFIDNVKNDNEYIFNYPSMLTVTILHGFEMYKSYNCITYVSKILEFVSNINLSKKYYKYDLNELELDLKDFYFKKDKFVISKLTDENTFYNNISFLKRKNCEIKLLNECFYRMLFHKPSKRYNNEKYVLKIKRKSEKTFDRLSSTYDSYFSGYNPRKNYNKILSLIAKNKKLKILDVGCGTGEILYQLSIKNNKYELYGLDISNKMLDVAKRKDKNNVINYICGDAEKLPFNDSEFDLIINSESFHHYPNPQNVLKEFKRVLKKDGEIIICDMYRPFPIRNIMNFAFKFTNTGDVKIYTIKQMNEMLLNEHFDIIYFKKYYSSYIYKLVNKKCKM